MKLLTRSTYYYLLFSFIIMIFAGVTLYFTIRSIIYNQINESLITEKTIIQDQIEDTDSIPDFKASFGRQIEVKLLNMPTVFSQTIKDTDIYDAGTERHIPYRYLRYSNNTPGKTGYVISISQVLDEKNELLYSIGLGTILLFVTLLIVSIAVNYLVSKRVWNPFFSSLDKAAEFDILSDTPLELPDSKINEFKKLNNIIGKMTGKMRADYINLKEYNENSSHEIQTPLAVIRAKLDLLMQNSEENQENISLINSISDSVNRLFKLNQGLLLLSRIENFQFPEISEISLREIIERNLSNYEEILKLKGIRVEKELTDNGIIRMNQTLADILITNLLSNSIRYNLDGGFIKCRLDDKILLISNSGQTLEIDPSKLFNRFQQGTANQQSIGLGLAIVKKITDFYGMQISYTFIGNVHNLELHYRTGNITRLPGIS